MEKLYIKKYGIILCVILAILAAMALRRLKADSLIDSLFRVFRPAIYIGLFLVWGVSLRRRIIHPQVRRCLITISGLIVFWITVRTIRYSINDCIWLIRYLWYLYYLPMLLIPLLALFVALSLGKAESFRMPKWTMLLYIPTAALFLLVLTNDLHQSVFVFPSDAAVWMNDYHFGAGYPLTVGWMVVCAAAALFTMLYKCRISHSRKILMLPFIPAILAVIYGVLYSLRALDIFELAWLKAFAGDMTVVYCLLFGAALEGCIQSGLIQSNTGYDELFLVTRLGAQITDHENAVCLASYNAKRLTEEQKRNAGTQTVLTDDCTIVRSRPIGFGHVLWQEDVSELTEAIGQIRENCRDLAEHNRIRQKNLETQKKILALQEKNRVTDLLNRETAGQIDRIDRILKQYDRETDAGNRRRLLAAAAVTGAYIKRYGNLLLVSERVRTADIRDLSRCFDESFVNLDLLGVNCLHTLPSGISLVTGDMLRVYRGFETAVEASLYDLSHVWIHMREHGGGVLLNVELVCDTDLSSYAQIADSFSREDGSVRFTFALQRGGGIK